ncbi:hypothetical protein ACWEVD_02595 [Nocardia thailandica]|uniref:Uncharacterized protein n=1 Tax=Nocardia thailandica TaxID=257275 RepID=A0ABW6PJQ1_9NOCA
MASPAPGYHEYGSDPYSLDGHRCGGACGRPGCSEVPQGYSHTVPIHDEGYGQRAAVRETRPSFGPAAPLPVTGRATRAAITVLIVLLVDLGVGVVGFAYGSTIDLFG